MDLNHLIRQIVATAVFAAIGVALLAGAIKLIQKCLPFSLAKEIGEDQNTALAIVMGAIIIGLSIVVAAAVAG
jgi:uncharacterized membrane protein YjfL (UPF0719 family)